MERAYTLILTKGVHIVSTETAAQICEAIETNKRLVDVELDPFGGAEATRRTTIAVAHVIALSETDLVAADIVPASSDKVHRLRSRGR